MKSRKGFSSLSVQLTATVSVTLVLLLLGMVATIGMSAHSVTTKIKERMGFDLVLTEESTLDDVNAFKQRFAQAPYVSSYLYHSPEEILDTWRQDMGENLDELLDMNPFLPEFEVNVKAAYSVPDSLDAIMLPLADMPQVQEINSHMEVAEDVNRSLSTLMMVLVVALLALLPISIVLINNTVRLTIFSQRFIIHTMKLVGASRGFIRRPFLISNTLQGLLAAVVACALLVGIYYYVWGVDASLQGVLSVQMLVMVCIGMTIAGPLLCVLCAAWSTQKYLTRSYDDLF